VNRRPLIVAVSVVGLALTSARAFAKDSGGGGSGWIGRAGDIELGIEGLYDLDPDDRTAAYLDLHLGYFFVDSVAFGVHALNGTTRDGQRDATGIFGEYDLMLTPKVTPFAGLEAKHVAAPVDSDGEDARVGALHAGAKLLVSGRAALALTFSFEYATHPVLGSSGALKRRNRDLDLGLRLFF
jgi:hypothetical protein